MICSDLSTLTSLQKLSVTGFTTMRFPPEGMQLHCTSLELSGCTLCSSSMQYLQNRHRACVAGVPPAACRQLPAACCLPFPDSDLLTATDLSPSCAQTPRGSSAWCSPA